MNDLGLWMNDLSSKSMATVINTDYREKESNLDIITDDHMLKGVYSQQCIKRSPLGQEKNGPLRQTLKTVLIHTKFSMIGKEKGEILIQVTAWASFTLYVYRCM